MIEPYVLEAIQREMEHQTWKYGENKQQSFAGFLLILEQELQEAKDGWMRSIPNGRDSALAEVVQIVATGIACLNRYGVVGCPASLNDSLPSE